jgi:hypothetical protein
MLWARFAPETRKALRVKVRLPLLGSFIDEHRPVFVVEPMLCGAGRPELGRLALS